MTVPELYLILSAAIFCFGLFGVLTYQTKAKQLINLEMMYLGLILIFALFAQDSENSVYLYIFIFINSIHIILFGLFYKNKPAFEEEHLRGEQ